MGNFASTNGQRGRRTKIRKRFRSYFDVDTIEPSERKHAEDNVLNYKNVGNKLHASNFKGSFPNLCDGCGVKLAAKKAESLDDAESFQRQDSEIDRILSGLTRIQLTSPCKEADESLRKVAKGEKNEIQDEETQASHVEEVSSIEPNKVVTMVGADDVAVLLKGVGDQLCILLDTIQRILPKSTFAAATPSPEAWNPFENYVSGKVPSEDSFETMYSGGADNSDGLYEEPMLATLESSEALTLLSTGARLPEGPFEDPLGKLGANRYIEDPMELQTIPSGVVPRAVPPPRYPRTMSGKMGPTGASLHPRLPTIRGRVKSPMTSLRRPRPQTIRGRAKSNVALNPSETPTVAEEEPPGVPSGAVVPTEAKVARAMLSLRTSPEASSSMVTPSSAFSGENLFLKSNSDMPTIVVGDLDEGSVDGRDLDRGKGGSIMSNAFFFWKEGEEEAVGCWRCPPNELVQRMSPDSTPVIVKVNRACCSRCALHMPLILEISLAYPSFPFIVVDVSVNGGETPTGFSFLAVQNGQILARQVNVAPSETKATFQYFSSKFKSKSAQ